MTEEQEQTLNEQVKIRREKPVLQKAGKDPFKVTSMISLIIPETKNNFDSLIRKMFQSSRKNNVLLRYGKGKFYRYR